MHLPSLSLVSFTLSIELSQVNHKDPNTILTLLSLCGTVMSRDLRGVLVEKESNV
jgi:hypothetical protein